jgi:integrase
MTVKIQDKTGWRNWIKWKMKVPGVKCYVSKGIAYAYDRKTGTRLTPPHNLYSVEWFAALDAARAKAKPIKEKAGTWGEAVAKYRTTPQFTGRAARTKADYQNVLDWTKPLHGMPLAQWTRGFVAELRNKAKLKKGRRFANYVLSVVSVVFSVAIELELADTNPVREVKKIRRPKNEPRANRPWTDEEWEAVIDAAPRHLLAPILLGGVLGYRQGEVLSVPKGSYNSRTGTLQRISSKNGKLVTVQATERLVAALADLPSNDAPTLVVSTRKQPWTEDGFRTSFFRVIRRLEAAGKIGPGLTFHGLRHTAATRMRELGFDTRTIADMLGQETEGMAGHYSREADLEPKLRGVVSKLNREARKKARGKLDKSANLSMDRGRIRQDLKG